jgi:hypothetical protein
MAENISNGSVLMWTDYDPSKVLKARKGNTGCHNCPLQEKCRERLRDSLWLCCEIPDQHDYARLRNGISTYDPEILSYRLTPTGFEKISPNIQQRFA